MLRQRLAATENGAAQVHPDADTLTAFVERSLPSTESETVVAHLSVCEPCREVVVLTQSLLAEPATQTVLAPAPVARWRRLFTPAFGAIATVAAMAVIAFMVVQLPEKHLAAIFESSNLEPNRARDSTVESDSYWRSSRIHRSESCCADAASGNAVTEIGRNESVRSG